MDIDKQYHGYRFSANLPAGGHQPAQPDWLGRDVGRALHEQHGPSSAPVAVGQVLARRSSLTRAWHRNGWNT